MNVATQPGETRIAAFNSLRGIAACAVIFHHLGLLFGFPEHSFGSFIIHYSPLRVLFAGHMAVLLFFVLSGFALSMMLRTGMGYRAYVIRRVSRIMLPLWGALVLSAVLYFLISPQVLGDVPAWVNGALWSQPMTGVAFARHAFLFGLSDDIFMDSVIWSLVYEMRISLIFPALYLLGQRKPVLTAAGAGLLYFAMRAVMDAGHISLYTGNDAGQSLVLTLYYVPFFVIGFCLCHYRVWVREKVAGLKGWQVAVATVAVFVLLIDKHDILTGLGAAGVMALALGRAGFRDFLEMRVFQFLGRISYSLYLTHLMVIVGLVQVLHGHAGVWVVAGLTLVLAPPVGYLFFVGVERPAIRLGHKYAS